MAVAAGGTLWQDLHEDCPRAEEHQQLTPPSQTWHEVNLQEGATCAALGAVKVQVNSTHRQAVRDPGTLRITGRASDGVVEAAELPGHPFCVGVQWHPEAIGGGLYPELCRAALAYAATRRS